MPWLLLAIGILILASSNINKFIERYSVEIIKLKVNWSKTIQSAGKYIVLDAILGVRNPTTTRAKIKSVTIVLFYNGIQIGTLKQTARVEILNDTTTPVPVMAVIDVKNLAANIKAAVVELLKEKSIQVQCRGFVDIGLAKIPFDTETSIDV